jgi:hypothetical protein
MPVDIKSGPAGVEAPRDPAHRDRSGETVDEHTISPAGDPFYAASRRDHQDDRPHGCYGGYHYLGWESEEEGELVEVYDKVRCRRCEREDG